MKPENSRYTGPYSAKACKRARNRNELKKNKGLTPTATGTSQRGQE